jgi:hypothetical protein
MTGDLVCKLCRDQRWVCEAHPDKPMEHDCCGGAGMPCPTCNAGDGQPELQGSDRRGAWPAPLTWTASSRLSVRRRRRGTVFDVYQRDAGVALPQLYRATIGEVLGMFKRCFVVQAMNLSPANNVAVFAQRVERLSDWFDGAPDPLRNTRYRTALTADAQTHSRDDIPSDRQRPAGVN